ncbi:MAG: V-type ATPase 116kDa subunit family protein [Candidatus Omnitrophota bacterium]
MKKITLLIYQKHANSAVGELRKLGLMHIKSGHEPQADAITSFEHRIRDVDKVLEIIGGTAVQKENLEESNLPSYIKEAIDLDSCKQKLVKELGECEEKGIWYEEWGNVSLRALRELKEAGLFIKFYSCDKNALKHMPKDKLAYVVRRKPNKIYIAFVSRDENESLNFSQAQAPHESLHSLQKRIAGIKEELKRIEGRLAEISVYRNCFLLKKKELLKHLEFYKVRFSMAHSEEVYCLEGFCPKKAVYKIVEAAKIHGWATVIQDPDKPAETPTLIRNPKWIEIIKPIFKFMGTVPGYNEYDISLWFLIFFSIFFAMLVGDAGYGFLFLAATFFAQRKFKKAQENIFFLLYLLSGGTVVWGALTGTWFGFEKIAQLPVLNYFVIDSINSFVGSNQIFMIYLCFFIGAIHLTIAHGIRAFRFINSRLALSQIGWISIVWSVFFIAGKLVLNRAVPAVTLPLFVFGASLVILFSYPEKNIFKGALLSLSDFPLKVISSFSDVVSYLRLFAVGYATVAVAMAFNNMALGSGVDSIFSGIMAAMILFVGHTLNILLALMAVVVHGIRLNILEFSGHLDMAWSGKEYTPFKD